MKFSFCPAINQKLFTLGDAEDEDAPLIKIEFCNEFKSLSYEKKKEMALDMFKAIGIDFRSSDAQEPK